MEMDNLIQRSINSVASRALGVRRWDVIRIELLQSQRFLLFTLFGAYFLDNILLTVVVPILPRYLLLADRHECDEDNSQFNATLCENLPTPFISEDVIKESNRVGRLISSKAFVQLVANPLVGIITRKYGYRPPMHYGLYVLLASTLLFAVGSSYAVLFLARSLHGIGSSCICIAGMGIVAASFSDEKERSRAMGEVLGGMALGVLFGYVRNNVEKSSAQPLGGVLYDFYGKSTPFILISFIAVILIVLQTLAFGNIFDDDDDNDDGSYINSTIVQLNNNNNNNSVLTPSRSTSPRPPLMPPPAASTALPASVLSDPYILAVACIICTTTTAMAVLEPCLPIWLMDTLDPPEWQIGTVFIPDSVGYFIGCNYFSVFAYKKGRWKCALTCVLAISICSFLIPLAQAVWQLMIPHFGLGLALGITDAALMPLLAHLVDMRHKTSAAAASAALIRRPSVCSASAAADSNARTSSYGSVFAIGQTAVCLAYSFGPFVGSAIATHYGFSALMRSVAILNFLTTPVCLFLRSESTACAQLSLQSQDQKKTTHAFTPLSQPGAPLAAAAAANAAANDSTSSSGGGYFDINTNSKLTRPMTISADINYNRNFNGYQQ